MTAPVSAYPRTVADLVPGALALADQLGEIPSRNRLMQEFKIGAPKAGEIRAELVRKAETDPGAPAEPAAEPIAQVTADGHPGTDTVPAGGRRAVVWPVVLLALPAFVAIWSGWVGLGGLTGFGVVHPLPGIADGFSINTAITLPIGVETYGAYALYVWLSGRVPDRARRFAKWSAIASLVVGALGQVAYHLLVAAGITSAPWWITTAVACLPVAVLGMGAALAHLVREGSDQ